MELLSLFWAFVKIGAFTFGGGYAMLPMLQREIVDNRHWATEEELMDYFAIGQCTPGVIAVNTATFVGHKIKGVLGGVVATLGVVFPSLIIICALAGVIEAFKEIQWVQHAFGGIRVCVCVLIANAVVKLLKKAVIDWPTGVIFGLVMVGAVIFSSVTPIVFVVTAAALGMIISAVKGRKQS